jgi:SHS2 domain-containing protein
VYRWVEHASELQLELDSASETDVFLDALAAVAELLDGDEDDESGQRGVEIVERAVSLEAPDRARLLAAWLDELAFLAETEGFVPASASGLGLGEAELTATVHGRIASPRHLIKATTYHHLRFEAVDGRWQARAILDV